MEAERAKETDKPMEDSRRNILISARKYLVEDMNVEEVLIRMPHVFTPAEEEKINSMPTQQEQCVTFLKMLPKRGDNAYDLFKTALKEVSPHLISTLDQAAETTIERQKSAGLEGKLRSLQNEREKIANERDELRKQLDMSKEQFNDFKILLKNLADKVNPAEELRYLQTVLDDERKKKEEIEKDRDELRRKLQEKEAELNNVLKKRLIHPLNEKETTAGQAEQTDLNSNELQVSPTIQGLDDVTREENTCTEEEKVKDIFKQLENFQKEGMQLFERAKELIKNHFEKTPADLEGNSHGTQKRKTNTSQESKKERELVKQKEKLEKQKENLEKKVKVRDNEIEECKERLSEVKKKCDQFKEESDRYHGELVQLREDRNEWKTKSEKFEDKICKSRIFVSSIFLPFDDHAPTSDVICHLNENKLARMMVTRSSDGHGSRDAADIIHNRKGPPSATEKKPQSWWQIDLGENHLLFITHYALTDQKWQPALTSLKLHGSSDGLEWNNLTNIHVKDATGCSHLTSTWRVKGDWPGYRYFRIVQTSKTAHGIRLCAIWLYGVLVEIKTLAECLKL